jgi:midasin
MNISDLSLPANFNFYHDTIPAEARLLFTPLAKIQERVRDIMAEYESPLLNDVLFLSNYMMVTFNTKSTPLMKLLTGMEMLLEKLDEWEAYASKKLNSCQDEVNLIKQLIIRYRKIQILSWRNLLNHYRTKSIKSDFVNCVRLIHTLEKQVFDGAMYRPTKFVDQTELEIFDLLDLFIRDSSLGLFESRLNALKMVLASFEMKKAKLLGDESI